MENRDKEIQDYEILQEIKRRLTELSGPDYILANLKQTIALYVKQMYEAGYAQALKDNAGWIKCSERMPENKDYVIVSVNEVVFIAPRFYDNGYWYEYGSSCTRQDYTHWQPLPDPPKQ